MPGKLGISSLQWGHDEGVVEGEPSSTRRSQWPRFNGATTKASWKAPEFHGGTFADRALQWGHDEGVVEGYIAVRYVRSRKRCFNGATTKASWKARRGFGPR